MAPTLQILQLPTEILEQVTFNLSVHDCKHLSQCCRALNNICAAKLWYHVHLSFPTKYSTLDILPRVSQNEDQESLRKQFFYHTHSTLPWYTHIKRRDLQDFCTACLQRQPLRQMFQHVQVLTVDVPFYLTKSRISQKRTPNTSPIYMIEDDETLVNWVLCELVPKWFVNLTLIEASTALYRDIAENERVPALYHMIEKLPHVKRNIIQRLGWDCIPPPERIVNQNTGVLSIYWSHRLNQLRALIGKQLPSSVTSCFLHSPSALDAHELRQFLASSLVLYLRIECEFINNPDGLQWVPSTVVDLRIYDRRTIDSSPVLDPGYASSLTMRQTEQTSQS